MKKIIIIFFEFLAMISIFLLIAGKDLFSIIFGDLYIRFFGGIMMYVICIFNILLSAFVLNKMGEFNKNKSE